MCNVSPQVGTSTLLWQSEPSCLSYMYMVGLEVSRYLSLDAHEYKVVLQEGLSHKKAMKKK